MKLRALLKRSIFVIISSLIVTACSQGTDCSVRKIKFDQDWKFHLGQMEDAAKESYDDSEWRVLNLPHDWSVEPLSGSDGLSVGPFSKESAGGFATGQTHLLLTVKMLTNFILFILKESMRSPKYG